MKNLKIEANDISALLVVLNVILLIAGWAYAPYFGIMNCVWGLMNAIAHKEHFNVYVINIAILLMNVYFLR